MKRLTPFLVTVFLTLSLHAAEERRELVTINVGTNASQTATILLPNITGKINEVSIDVIGTGATGDVSIVVMPELSTMDAVPIYTNATLAADITTQPRLQCEDDAGTAISGVYDKFNLYRDTIRVIWANGGATGVTVNAVIKYEKE